MKSQTLNPLSHPGAPHPFNFNTITGVLGFAPSILSLTFYLFCLHYISFFSLPYAFFLIEYFYYFLVSPYLLAILFVATLEITTGSLTHYSINTVIASSMMLEPKNTSLPHSQYLGEFTTYLPLSLLSISSCISCFYEELFSFVRRTPLNISVRVFSQCNITSFVWACLYFTFIFEK